MNNHDFSDLICELTRSAEQQGITSLSDFRDKLEQGKLMLPLVYGGHTTCTEVTHGNQQFYIDMGTGITDAAAHAMNDGRTDFKIFQTHLHWDHVMGLPFFVPAYLPGNRVTIYHLHQNAPEYIKIQFNGVNFPVKWDQLGATIEFKKLKLYEELIFDDVIVTPFKLDHPGGSFGYHFKTDQIKAAIGVDGEYKRLTREALKEDLPFLQKLDLLLFDAQYSMPELASRFDWGHCTPNIGVDLALREGIRKILLSHHDPRSTTRKIEKMTVDAQKHLKTQIHAHQELWNQLSQPEGPVVIAAYDGLEVDLGS